MAIGSNKSLKNHLTKTIFINKLAPIYKEFVFAKEFTTFQEAKNLDVALWRKRYPSNPNPSLPWNQNLASTETQTYHRRKENSASKLSEKNVTIGRNSSKTGVQQVSRD